MGQSGYECKKGYGEDGVHLVNPNEDYCSWAEKKKDITQFRGDYFFLSNFYQTEVEYEGIFYRNSEAAYQAQKAKTQRDKFIFTTLSGKEAKYAGRNIPIRDDWDEVKLSIMEEIVRRKFEQNQVIRKKLLDTGDALLVEGNDWGDEFWGVDLKTGIGANNLGKILMKIRSEFRRE